MPKKKQPARFKIYLPVSGGLPIAAQEIGRQSGIITVLDPVFVQNRKDGTGYELTPVQYLGAGDNFRLYTSGLLGDLDMPTVIRPWFEKYQERRRADEENDPN